MNWNMIQATDSKSLFLLLPAGSVDEMATAAWWSDTDRTEEPGPGARMRRPLAADSAGLAWPRAVAGGDAASDIFSIHPITTPETKGRSQ